MKLYPYKQGSVGAKALADALDIKQLKHEGKPIYVKGCLINWGATQLSLRIAGVDENDMGWPNILNQPINVAKAANKLEAFKALSLAGVSVPQWTEDHAIADQWLGEKKTVVCRTVLNGHSGVGIHIRDIELEPAPLYTQYIKKKDEYRIHVFQGEAFFVQRKARKLDVPAEEVNWKVRNLAGGFIFAHKDVEVDNVARVQAVAAVHALALDFGAVDIIHGSDGVFYVLEVNTAPGLQGATLDAYVEKFKVFK